MSELSARVRIASEARPLPKMWIGFMLGIIFLAAELIASVWLINSDWHAGNYTIITISALIWFYWLYCVFKIHDAVCSIPGYTHPITPARAVGMHFVPFYNFYWVFKWPSALAGFVNWRMQSKSMNGLAERFRTTAAGPIQSLYGNPTDGRVGGRRDDGSAG